MPEKSIARGVIAILGIVVMLFSWRFLIPTPRLGIVADTFDLELLRPVSPQNASSIFNTIQGALKSKNAQIEPIGVSFIPAYIPEGTLLFHGNTDGKVPSGLEWIAMDHEFSFSFIGDRGGPRNNNTYGPGSHGQGGPGKGPGHAQSSGKHQPPDGRCPGASRGHGRGESHPFMLTFRVQKPLNRMILLDGSSAAKTATGEMDQQFILAGVNESQHEHVNEHDSAEMICEWGSKFGLDGFIRIEVGFEAVICDFRNLELVSNITIEWKNDTLGLPLEVSGELTKEYDLLNQEIGALAGYDQIKLGNVHDNGEGRILLDYTGFQTAINRTYVGVDPYTRRIYNISADVKSDIMTNLENALQKGSNPYRGTDWQLVTTEIVDKFSPLLKLLNQTLSSSVSDIDKAKNVTLITANFVRMFMDSDESQTLRGRILEAKRRAIRQYAHPYQPLQSDADILIYSSIHEITRLIVDQLFECFWESRTMIQAYFKKEESDFSALKMLEVGINDLMSTLGWESTFYRCPQTCNWDEVCYTPSWGPSPLGWENPWGKSEDAAGKLRINAELQCLSYRTIKSHGGW